MRMTNIHTKTVVAQKGVILFIALVTASIVLAIGMSILHLTLKDFVLSSAVRESEMAFSAADAGMECALYWQQSNAGKALAPGGAFAPGSRSISCMNAPSNIPITNVAGATTTFQIEWGTPRLCARVEVRRDVAPTNCIAGTCIKVISRGYNRACDQLTGTRVIERALRAYFYEP